MQVNAPLTETTWGRGCVALVVKTKMADISLILRVSTGRNNSYKHGKNVTARRQLEGRHLLYGEYYFAKLNNPKRALSKMNLTSMDRWRKQILAMFFFFFELSYHMKYYGDLGGCYPPRPRRITPSSISIILHKILSLIH